MTFGPIEVTSHRERGRVWPALLWRAPAGSRSASSALLGGGLAPIDVWVNATVHRDYDEPDPVAHVHGLAERIGATGRVCGMITAADVGHFREAADGGVRVVATVGLGLPTLAAAPDEAPTDEVPAPERPGAPRAGTINLLVAVPVPLGDAALLNALMTATEAKTQALFEAGYRATGTASDAVCVVCPRPGTSGAEPYGGPRSVWGARVARAVHAAVLAGAHDWRDRHEGAGRLVRSGRTAP